MDIYIYIHQGQKVTVSNHLRLLYVGDHVTDVVGENAVQRGSPLAVLPQHEQTHVLLRGHRTTHVHRRVLGQSGQDGAHSERGRQIVFGR